MNESLSCDVLVVVDYMMVYGMYIYKYYMCRLDIYSEQKGYKCNETFKYRIVHIYTSFSEYYNISSPRSPASCPLPVDIVLKEVTCLGLP